MDGDYGRLQARLLEITSQITGDYWFSHNKKSYTIQGSLYTGQGDAHIIVTTNFIRKSFCRQQSSHTKSSSVDYTQFTNLTHRGY